MITENASGAVVYRLVDDQIQYLLLKSATSDFWGFPKGHVEGDESDIATAVREIREETQLVVAINPEFHADLDYDMANGHHKHVVLYTALVPADSKITRQVEEISDFGWFDYPTARQTLSYDNLKGLLDQANTYLEGHHDA
ncbi:MAG: bis(5'-nucleosyl)-tetraphosphatase [Levilactobacillus sp.]|jgi:8-oxo-dGTP pyrophosphatase MutT (NUDIX family)|uniref:bis(5'-nucleosyl)-tetraphosphatase n=1 Tax=Levilactobacillus sp. TaxID=2767919 RepID=UPI002587DE45|nr:bis(5'-nucleosyl)-tetraphosphatase [Levilactobacillus sp.]MCH4123675.1 bis(5'-nucleosyl)-tetraphosphatase [Levilactobacillus sp.]MCI1553773.1 bis(5'-nucleosyl)-tetraphosphatase [Levilactobacillus sp.]MCI1599540.1 bis(5'-nucleosyl)-tetraphosphatase [Levilactobacillus sp.]MCI1605387.1 bis(5'-nucleosyl)-tetraphosphatase [Levilactobacillus sp.]